MSRVKKIPLQKRLELLYDQGFIDMMSRLMLAKQLANMPIHLYLKDFNYELGNVFTILASQGTLDKECKKWTYRDVALQIQRMMEQEDDAESARILIEALMTPVCSFFYSSQEEDAYDDSFFIEERLMYEAPYLSAESLEDRLMYEAEKQQCQARAMHRKQRLEKRHGQTAPDMKLRKKIADTQHAQADFLKVKPVPLEERLAGLKDKPIDLEDVYPLFSIYVNGYFKLFDHIRGEAEPYFADQYKKVIKPMLNNMEPGSFLKEMGYDSGITPEDLPFELEDFVIDCIVLAKDMIYCFSKWTSRMYFDYNSKTYEEEWDEEDEQRSRLFAGWQSEGYELLYKILVEPFCCIDGEEE